MNSLTLIFILYVSLISTAFAAPSKRPLPPNIVTQDPDFHVLRDHVESRTFYLVPKRLDVFQNQLSPFAAQDEGCRAVDLYHQAQKSMIEGRLKLLEIATGKTPTSENVSVRLIQAQIDGIEASLETFENKVIRAAALVKIRVGISQTVEKVRKRFGFRDTDNVRFPEIAELSVSPTSIEALPYPEVRKRKREIGVFEADWSPKPFGLHTGDFGSSLLLEGTTLRPFPTELQVSQAISLHTYCALKNSPRNLPGELYLPVTVSVAVATWEDSKGPSFEEWFLYRKRLSPLSWSLVSSLPLAEEKDTKLSADPGEPRLYSGDGVFRPTDFEIEIPNEKRRNQ